METGAPPPGADLDGVEDEECSEPEGSQEGGGDEDDGAKQGRVRGSVKWALRRWRALERNSPSQSMSKYSHFRS